MKNAQKPRKTAEQISKETGVPVAELVRHSQRLELRFACSGDPTPGPLADAFPSKLVKISGLIIRPVVAVDFPILRQLDSPLARQMMEAAKPVELRQPTIATDEESWEMILQFTRDPEEVESLLASGRDKFRAAARQQIGMRMNPFVATQIVTAIGKQFHESFSTALQYEPEEDKTSFREPPAPATA